MQRDDALVGPVLPLPILLTFDEYRNGHSKSGEEGVFSLEREIRLQCDEIKQVASEMALSDSSCELHGDQAVFLADERDDMWAVLKNQNLFVYTIQLHLSALPWITYRTISLRMRNLIT